MRVIEIKKNCFKAKTLDFKAQSESCLASLTFLHPTERLDVMCWKA